MTDCIEARYEYHVHTWGGFYNKEYKDIHKKQEGDHYFKTDEERQSYIKELREIEQRLGANFLVVVESEGYHCRVNTVLHRVIEWEGKRYYSNYDLGVDYGYSDAEYFMNYKWTLGCNCYPLGEDFDYDNLKPTIVQEWITGAFNVEL